MYKNRTTYIKRNSYKSSISRVCDSSSLWFFCFNVKIRKWYDHIVKLLKHKLYFFILQNLLTIIYYVTLIKTFNEFKQRFKNIYINNFYKIKIFNVIILKNVVNRTLLIVILKNVVNRTSQIVTSKNVINNTLLIKNNRTTKTLNQFVNKLFRDIRF